MAEEALPTPIGVSASRADQPKVTDAAFVLDSQIDRKSVWLIWAGVAGLVVATLFCFGQLALWMPTRIPSADAHSRLRAEYDLWPQMIVQPVSAGLLDDLRTATPGLPTGVAVSGNNWGVPPQGGLPPSPLPSYTPAPSLGPTATVPEPIAVIPNPTQVQPTLFFTPDPTQFVIQPTARPTRTAPPFIPLPASTQTPTQTATREPATQTPRLPQYSSPTPSSTSTTTPTHTATPTRTATITPTATATPTPTGSATPTSTATRTITPVLPGYIGEGTPDGTYEPIQCGSRRVIDFGSPRVVNSLVFYEYFNPAQCVGDYSICLDHLRLYLSNAADYSDRIPIFNWGDTDPTNNGYIYPYHHPETDDEGIPSSELYPNNQPVLNLRTGVCVNVNAIIPYRYLIIEIPGSDCDDEGEIDSIEINVDLRLCPFSPSQVQPETQ